MRDPRHILITGASSGIGAALALEYAASGMRLSLHGRNLERLSQVAEQARERGAEVTIHGGDIANQADMAAWIAAQDSKAAIDLIIANAGISGGSTPIAESAEQTAAIFATNVSGVFNTVQPALAVMARRRRGQIAIVSSLAGFRGFAGASAYCASKAAVRVYGEGLRSEMAAHKVEINVICPGFIKTPMTDVNPFPMPLIMSGEKAAQIIRGGLERNHARIAFPWPLYALAVVLAVLPQRLMDFIATRLPRKSR